MNLNDPTVKFQPSKEYYVAVWLKTKRNSH